jgi:hypothetical protein
VSAEPELDLVVKQSDARRGEAMTLMRVIELPALPAQPVTVPVKKRRRRGLKRVSKAGISHGITSAMQAGIGRGR